MAGSRPCGLPLRSSATKASLGICGDGQRRLVGAPAESLARRTVAFNHRASRTARLSRRLRRRLRYTAGRSRPTPTMAARPAVPRSCIPKQAPPRLRCYCTVYLALHITDDRHHQACNVDPFDERPNRVRKMAIFGIDDR